MYEGVDQWDYVIGAYAVSAVALGWLLAWSWRGMVRAEKRREETRRKGGR